MDLMLRERSQIQKSIYCMIPFLWNSRECKLIYTDRKQIRGCLELGVRGRIDCKGTRGWGLIEICILLIVLT